jgi:nitroreductase
MARFEPLKFAERDPASMEGRSADFFEEMSRRRSVRAFRPDPIPLEAVRRCIDTAAQAPSGAHKQPWTFVLVTDSEIKRRIREAAEAEERAFYGGRAPRRWLDDLEPFGTDAEKPFLEDAPALIVIFARKYGEHGERHYYVNESVGIATGFLLAALHHAGFATLTHTPSPMTFLSKILERPENERPFLLVPVGLPARDLRVPKLRRKTRKEVLVEFSPGGT